ncbi:MAG: nucleotidyltransferase domain-containing protein [Planctomycetaceae bacterium]|jgi:predicted nucleotidyltransferase|nr:nucleotidyltransferase domain-containing protein [Planctomycetaceae bacterium]
MLGLTENEIRLIVNCLSKTAVKKAMVFGSRAKGNHRTNSDIDIAVSGCQDVFDVEHIAALLNDLPLCYQFDVQGSEFVKNALLNEHIRRVGITIYERERE